MVYFYLIKNNYSVLVILEIFIQFMVVRVDVCVFEFKSEFGMFI